MIDQHTVIQPLKPSTKDWEELRVDAWVSLGYDCQSWLHKSGFYVISAVEVVDDPKQVKVGPEYHLSMSLQTPQGPQRVDSNDAKWILKEFGLEGAEEDNHVQNGKARNFWRPVNNNAVGLECPCKDSEPKTIEDKGDFIIRPT